ncbi:hypothetical protein FH608_006175 [Nonomuraea phyllanthi]|uniref:DUF4333 domain-containing protein n=1 Tax=Nonomuraea phyllanthi TaxID=2219224 RepID=A0A5C4WSQ4_9ACTN|nr:hypothetical protein [Nonomuraea phyllanthi]KAB8196344.1 hypothetical protein FH608_006175 [Nonomuraea phyllanthi]
MKRALVLTVAATALVATGCGRGCDLSKPPKPSAVQGKGRPVRIQPSEKLIGVPWAERDAAVPKPADPSPTEQMLYDLQHQTLNMAGALGEIDAGRCDKDIDTKVGFTTRCTVTYEGVEVPWIVEITSMGRGPYSGSFSVDYWYTARPLSVVVTARGVYDRFAWKLGGALEEHEGRCDKIPDVFLAKIGQELSYRCQKIEWSCDNGDFRFSWRDLRIRINDKGHLTFVE